MKIFREFFITVSCLFSMNVYSYDEFTHQDLSENAVLLSGISIDQMLLTNLGLQDFSSNEIFVNPNNVNGKKISIIGLFRNGAKFEDDFPRSLHHFFDPDKDRALTPPILGEIGMRSPDWALEDGGDVTAPLAGAQEYSYKEAMTYFFRALTLRTEQERELNWGKMFQTLGQVIHHVQDMSQPEHVRNDQHLTGVDSSWYEKYTNDHKGDSYFTNLMSAGSYPIPTFPTAREFWTTTDNRGIANFTNRNFFSKDTNFQYNDGVISASAEYSLPDPTTLFPVSRNISDADLLGTQGQVLCDYLKQNYTLDNPATGDCYIDFIRTNVTDNLNPSFSNENPMAASLSIFDDELERYNSSILFEEDDGDSVMVDRRPSLNQFNFQAAHNYLIPRAVAYSAGLINHFFRGKIDMIPNPVGDGWVIQNQSDEEAQGTFTLYYDHVDSADGIEKRDAIPGAVWNSTIAANSEVVVGDYVVPAGLIRKTLVFQGRIGAENNIITGKSVIGDHVVMIWIDESSSYQSNGSSWTIDINQYRNLIDSVIVKAGVLVPGNPVSQIFPVGVSAPPEISAVTSGRGTDSLQVYINHFNRIRDGIEPENIILAVDGSGSMTLNTIRPPYDEFIVWLASQYPNVSITEKTFGGERWLFEVNNYLEASMKRE